MGFGEYLGAGIATTKGLWHMNGNSNDSSGNGLNGIDSNISYSKSYGRFNEGAFFNGSTSVIQTPHSAISTGTLSIWINFSTLTSQHVFFCSNQNSLNSNNYIQFMCDSNGSVWVYTALAYSNYFQSPNGIILVNKWNNIIFTQTGTIISLYVNGQYISSKSWSYWMNITGANQFCIGMLKRSTQTYTPTNGFIDEVILENRVWSAVEVQKYYTYTKGWF